MDEKEGFWKRLWRRMFGPRLPPRICTHDPKSICHRCKKRTTCNEALDPEVAKVTDCITFESQEE